MEKKLGLILQSFRDFKEYHTDTTVKFVVKMNADKLRAAKEEGLHKVFKLQSVINTTSMVYASFLDCFFLQNRLLTDHACIYTTLLGLKTLTTY